MSQIPPEYNLSPDNALPYYNPRHPRLSADSTGVVPDSLWFASDFLLGAGAVIIQPLSGMIVLIYDRQTDRWCLPKGRKDLGESLENTVIREAYEEASFIDNGEKQTGYRAKFLPLAIPSLAPSPDPLKKASLNCEPIYVTTQTSHLEFVSAEPFEYVTFWYVLYIEEGAIRDEGTGMVSEEQFEPQLLDFSDAIEKLGGRHQQAVVVSRAWRLWKETLEKNEGKLWI
ncbi:hypothetical protein Clacol_008276 [Clathrus columnatus]|uniref:Nudix hydrolase domain-containing protein n=1 Tax=Clathrus columnatus TaxID=1419009 RepID=A0AAV5AMS3_9AGAM|nr:hypothetical protein Clacol_008276 [Clathrus columnatus]